MAPDESKDIVLRIDKRPGKKAVITLPSGTQITLYPAPKGGKDSWKFHAPKGTTVEHLLDEPPKNGDTFQ